MEIKDRIQEFTRVPASSLKANPKNWRTHPDHQKEGLKSVLDEIGFADAVIARRTDDGTLMLIDGHLRAETAEDAMIPTLIVDVTEEESDLMLATLDPLASLAGTDIEGLAQLMRSVSTENEDLSILLEDIRDNYSLDFHELFEQETDADFIEGGQEAENVQAEHLSGMKAIVLHFKEEEYQEFYEKAFELGERWALDNMSDVILQAIIKSHRE